jgi:hypothetical protein
MTYHTIAGQLVPGDDKAYVALSIPDIDYNTYATLVEAEVKLLEVRAAETGSREYHIYSY